MGSFLLPEPIKDTTQIKKLNNNMSEKNKNIASAKAKSLKTSITKVNLVLKMIRGKKAENALNILG